MEENTNVENPKLNEILVKINTMIQKNETENKGKNNLQEKIIYKKKM